MSLKQIMKEKREWKEKQKRVKALPADYQFVYKEIQKYIFKVSQIDEKQIQELFEGLIELFEHGASEGKKVLQVTGEDVASFCDDLLYGQVTYNDLVQEIVGQKVLKAYQKNKKS